MKIALCLNNDNYLTNFRDGIKIDTYHQEQEEWILDDTIPYSLENINSIQEIREEINRILNKINNCKILILKEISGIFYTIFETSGFDLWEMDGTARDVLHSFSLDVKNMNNEPKRIDFIIDKGEGIYEVNLIDAMRVDSSITSKSLLLPFIKNQEFYQIDIICSHIPPWFETKFEELALDYRSCKGEDGNYTLTIYKKTCIND